MAKDKKIDTVKIVAIAVSLVLATGAYVVSQTNTDATLNTAIKLLGIKVEMNSEDIDEIHIQQTSFEKSMAKQQEKLNEIDTGVKVLVAELRVR